MGGSSNPQVTNLPQLVPGVNQALTGFFGQQGLNFPSVTPPTAPTAPPFTGLTGVPSPNFTQAAVPGFSAATTGAAMAPTGLANFDPAQVAPTAAPGVPSPYGALPTPELAQQFNASPFGQSFDFFGDQARNQLLETLGGGGQLGGTAGFSGTGAAASVL